MKTRTKRGLVAGGAFLLVIVGLLFNTGTGTLSSVGYNAIATICPLGALESMLGTWVIVPRLLIILAVSAAIIFVFGRAFCSWVCPVPHVGGFFKTKKQKAAEREEQEAAATYAEEHAEDQDPAPSGIDTRHMVLGGALLSTALFGFPVFCLVCPVGLTFATFIALWRFVQFADPSWTLIIFPAILIIELVVLKKWCARICPLGALFSLLSRANKRFRPHIDESKCLQTAEGVKCSVCTTVCEEHIDPRADKGMTSLNECTKCKECSDACPTKAITFLPKKKQNAEDKKNQKEREKEETLERS